MLTRPSRRRAAQAAPAAAAAAPKPSDALAGRLGGDPRRRDHGDHARRQAHRDVRLASRYHARARRQHPALIAARWWDGESVYRVQENWVAQWGDASEKKPLPAGVTKSTRRVRDRRRRADRRARWRRPTLIRPRRASPPMAGRSRPTARATWLTHCYGSVGVARDAAPDSGTGSELFTPIGQSARRLDRNYAVVGRIVEGMSALSSLPRSEAAMGVYATAAERPASPPSGWRARCPPPSARTISIAAPTTRASPPTSRRARSPTRRRCRSAPTVCDSGDRGAPRARRSKRGLAPDPVGDLARDLVRRLVQRDADLAGRRPPPPAPSPRTGASRAGCPMRGPARRRTSRPRWGPASTPKLRSSPVIVAPGSPNMRLPTTTRPVRVVTASDSSRANSRFGASTHCAF